MQEKHLLWLKRAALESGEASRGDELNRQVEMANRTKCRGSQKPAELGHGDRACLRKLSMQHGIGVGALLCFYDIKPAPMALMAYRRNGERENSHLLEKVSVKR
jgi:hypothetical protein